MKIDWKSKLSSRKLWAALAAWITSLLTAFNVSDSVIAQVTILVSGVGALVVYMLAEAYIDGKSAGADIIVDNTVSIDDDYGIKGGK